MTAAWVPGKTYVPGSLVRPASAPPVSQTQAINGYFEDGATGWDFSGSCALATSGGYGSPNCCIAPGSTAGGEALNQAKFYGPAGTSISATCMIQQGASDVDHTRGYVLIHFYRSDDYEIGTPIKGNIVNDGRGGAWHPSTGAATFPAETSYARIGIYLYQNSADPIWGDNLVVSYAYQVPSGLVYKAVQPAPGKSGNGEPTWPLTLGVQVIDNEVIWEAVLATRITWEASPIMRSGATDPVWPTAPGGMVHDGDMDWIAVSSQITDKNCPNSKVVAIMASKVFAADKDIVRFSATVNPLDWTSSQDAGYLPTGLQQANSNDMAVLAPYRSNLTAFNASSFQNWQVDPDPSAMSLLDQMDGIGSSAQHAAQPVGNDLFYLSQLGVRSVGIAAGTDSLAAGDVGMSIDVLVRPAVVADDTTLGPRATYYPSAGQYWLAVGGAEPQTFVITMNGGKPKCSRYLFPFAVDAFAQLGNDLYIRHGDEVSVISEDVATDDVDGVPTDFAGLVQWAWLDNGQPGVTKMLESLDYVGTGQGPSLSIGYDQRDTAAFTDPYLIDPDTLPGDPIPIPVAAPTFSIKLDFAGGAAWSVNAVTLHLSSMAGQP
jgi:hypothetical protein